jgi:hypothetical protein
LTKSVTKTLDSENSIDVVGNEATLDFRQLAIIHFTFMAAYWVSILIAIVTLHLFHNPDWMIIMSFEFDLFALLLSIFPTMLVLSVNLGRMRKLMEVEPSEKSRFFVGCILILAATLLLLPTTLFMRSPISSIYVSFGIVVLETWLVVIFYVVAAGAIGSSSPKQFVLRNVRRLQFWLFMGLTTLLIILSLVPMVAGLLGSEAWQYYTFEELLIRRIPIFALFTWPTSILLPLLPFIVMYYATNKEIRFQL